ncbi:MAG: ATP-binding protein [Anaerolineae bacterium]|nr:ATP-binding protein [Anaerolineae bacterium]
MDSLGDLLNRMGRNTSQENTPPSSKTPLTTDGEPCPLCGQASLCGGLGVISYDVPVDHPNFGKLFRCPNNLIENDREHQGRMRRISNLSAFADKTFNNFDIERPLLSNRERESLKLAWDTAKQFAAAPSGWLLLEGTYGCGKTHLAAAIGNTRLAHGDLVLFITVPDLLDHLRSTYGPSSEVGYDEMFDRIRGAQMLILDDLGSENPSQWAGEKLFQLLNYRYSHRLPTVITTNVDLDRIDGRIRSRMLDEGLIRRARITAPDYRTPAENEESQLTNLAHYRDMTMDNFDTRTGLGSDEQKNLDYVLGIARQYATTPNGWLTIIGPYGSGKTHLAAAIANFQRDRGTNVMFTTLPDLMDYLRVTFNNTLTVSLQERFQLVLNAPLLVLDDLRAEQQSAWVREKLFQIIEYRYTGQLPTVITTAKQVEELDERIATRLLDWRRCQIVAITAPSYAQRIHRRSR